MGKNTLTKMKTLQFALSEAFNKQEYIEYPMFEGLNIDDRNKTISFTDEHEDSVDTSLIANPTKYSYKGYDIISIFKRKKFTHDVWGSIDGNPLVYALKGKYGWRWKQPKTDIVKFFNRFIEVSQKIQKQYDVVLIVPSTNDLNIRILNVVKEVVYPKIVCEDVFIKITKEEAANSINFDKLKKERKTTYEEDVTIITNAFRKMNKYLEMKDIPIPLRKYIEEVATLNNRYTLEEVSKMLEGKTVLLLDDTIASGTTISFCAKTLIDTFSPKNLTILTLLSKL